MRDNGTCLHYLKFDPLAVDLEDGFSRDMVNTGHHGTSDPELSSKAQVLLRRAYERG